MATGEVRGRVKVMIGLLRRMCDPRIERHLLADDGEVLVDEVTHHWFAYVRPEFHNCS